MSESEVPVERGEGQAASVSARSRRRPAAKKKTASPGPAAATRRKAAGAGARRKTVSSRRSATVRSGADIQSLVSNLAKKASEARDRLASASDGGAQATRRAWQKMSDASRKAIGRLGAEWKKMEPSTRVQVLAALFTTLAAASAPLVRKSLRRR
jgi:hypothetical protein